MLIVLLLGCLFVGDCISATPDQSEYKTTQENGICIVGQVDYNIVEFTVGVGKTFNSATEITSLEETTGITSIEKIAEITSKAHIESVKYYINCINCIPKMVGSNVEKLIGVMTEDESLEIDYGNSRHIKSINYNSLNISTYNSIINLAKIKLSIDVKLNGIFNPGLDITSGGNGGLSLMSV